jgi:hypothetical protein
MEMFKQSLLNFILSFYIKKKIKILQGPPISIEDTSSGARPKQNSYAFSKVVVGALNLSSGAHICKCGWVGAGG